MELTKLSYFVTAAECGNFSETARRLFTSQPNISKQISSLEAELGVQLFFRDRHTVRLTRAGEYFYEQTKTLPALMSRIAETTRALGRGDSGQLRVGVLAGQRLNADIISRFQSFVRQYPDVSFTMERAGFSELHESLASFRYDLIITLSFDVAPGSELVVERLIENQQPAIFVSRMSPLADKLDDLSQAPFVVISPKESYGGYEQFLCSCRSAGFEPNIVRLADSLDSLLFYVETGVGIAILDRNTRLEIDQNIKVIPMDDHADCPDLVAVYSRQNSNPHIRRMVDCLAENREE
ncbi:MAG: LysR family transcriptional regulator [Oscillospiraceae bacterium]